MERHNQRQTCLLTLGQAHCNVKHFCMRRKKLHLCMEAAAGARCQPCHIVKWHDIFINTDVETLLGNIKKRDQGCKLSAATFGDNFLPSSSLPTPAARYKWKDDKALKRLCCHLIICLSSSVSSSLVLAALDCLTCSLLPGLLLLDYPPHTL